MDTGLNTQMWFQTLVNKIMGNEQYIELLDRLYVNSVFGKLLESFEGVILTFGYVFFAIIPIALGLACTIYVAKNGMKWFKGMAR